MDKLIRNIPDYVIAKLAERAKDRGMPLGTYMRLLLIDAAANMTVEEQFADRRARREAFIKAREAEEAKLRSGGETPESVEKS